MQVLSTRELNANRQILTNDMQKFYFTLLYYKHCRSESVLGVQFNFQQYFSYIMGTSFIGRGNQSRFIKANR